MNLREQLEAQEKNFDRECSLLGQEWHSPGYHTRVPDNEWVHSTRTNIYYALALLEAGDPGRAAGVIRRVLRSQVTDPCDPAFGIWPWLDEEPVSEMAPPDWNWADFIGSGLCHILKEHGEKLDTELQSDIKTALERAGYSIFRRNIQPNYTNIAFMGAGVAGCAGELLDIPFLVRYARSRLKHILDYTLEQGGFNEFNSSTYSFIALHEAERILQLCEDGEIRKYAKELHRILWEKIAQHFHPATGQLGGAQSRAYTEYLPGTVAAFLTETTGCEIPSYAPGSWVESFHYDGIRHLPCPEKYRESFCSCTSTTELRERYIKSKDREVRGVTYKTPEAIFGSVNRTIFWTQCRPLTGYWKSNGEVPAMFRMRFFRDGKDFSSAAVRMAQSENLVLFALHMITNRGDHHPTLDRPADGVFSFSKLALRFELAAPDAEVLDDGTLSAGNYKVKVHQLPGFFNGSVVRWRSGREADRVYVEAVLYEGAETRLAFNESVTTLLGGGVELLPRDGKAANSPVIEEAGNEYRVSSGKLCVSAPRFAVGD